MRRECARFGRQPQRDDQIAGLERAFPARACRRADDEGLRPRSRAGRFCPRSPRRRRARPAARRNPTGGWRCRPHSSPAPRAIGSRRHGHRSPRPVRACCRRSRRRRNIRIVSAATDCRRRSRHCEAVPRRQTAAPRQSRDRTGRNPHRARDRHCEPARRCGRRHRADVRCDRVPAGARRRRDGSDA